MSPLVYLGYFSIATAPEGGIEVEQVAVCALGFYCPSCLLIFLYSPQTKDELMLCYSSGF
jgi:hypothetical protein